jgi:hypothetical protein
MKPASWLYSAWIVVLSGAIMALSPALASDEAPDADKTKAVAAMQTWLAQADTGDFAKTWNEAAKSFQTAVTSDQWVSGADQRAQAAGQAPLA